jgi:hypothetical protein
MTKVCKKCGLEKDLSEFPVCGENPSWIMGTCKDCKRLKDNEYSRRRNAKDRDKVNTRNAQWAVENREQDLERRKKYNREHRVELRAWHREHQRKLRATDVAYRIECALRARVHNALHGVGKADRTMALMGCSSEQVRSHLERMFRPGMTWENYGGRDGWQIDHVVPCASFDLSRPEEQRRCFHYTNLQPLWAEENMSKGARISKAA